MAAETITLEFLARQNEHLMTEVRAFREDMTVMMAILQRLDHQVSLMGTQLTDMHAYNRRIADRVSKIEERQL